MPVDKVNESTTHPVQPIPTRLTKADVKKIEELHVEHFAACGLLVDEVNKIIRARTGDAFDLGAYAFESATREIYVGGLHQARLLAKLQKALVTGKKAGRFAA